MPDSEDDFERRNRDKFVRERDYGNRTRDFADRNRRDFANGGMGSGMKRMTRREDEFVGLGSQTTPAAKRNRFDSACDSFEPQFVHQSNDGSQSVLLTFRRFLATLDESAIASEEEAIAKYVDYKLDFKKRELEKFFQTHKEEEWFRHKYHPEESKAVKAIQHAQVKKRLEVFNELLASGRFTGLSLDFVNAADIVRLMNAVVVKLEGGSDEDIAELDGAELDDESVAESEKLKAELKKTMNGGSETIAAETPTTNPNGNGESAADSTDENGTAKPTATDESAKKKKLHKTCSIHFKNIPIDAKLADVETICKQHPGFLRVGLTDPLPEAKLHRHGWVTYRRDVNIKEIFWGLKNAKLNGTDLGAVVNRDLKRRVRCVDGVATHRSVTQNDIRQAAKLIALYDYRARLFITFDDQSKAKFAETADGSEEAAAATVTALTDAPLAPLEDLERAIVESKNPLLDGAVEYLVEEASAEEEAYLGSSQTAVDPTADPTADDATAKIPLELDAPLLAVLDKFILYLRVVHSVDYYNCGEYANEDNMPNRLGLIHVRGQPATSSTKNATLLPKKRIDDHVEAHNARLADTLLRVDATSDEELIKLGKRDAEKVLQEFIDSNCVELAKDKWLCPLSGKKFKGPEFIHKHLQSKHSEKLDEVRDEVLYFNNYLLDPQRPRNPDPPKPTATTPAAANQPTPHQHPVPLAVVTSVDTFDRPPPSLFSGDPTKNGIHGGYRTGWNPRFGGGRGGFTNSGRPNRYFDSGAGDNGVRKDPRPQVAYRDLDAPDEIF